MNRPIKNLTRGKQKGSLPAKSAPAHAMNVSSYNGRENVGAGGHVQQASLDDAQGDGYVVGWLKPVSGE